MQLIICSERSLLVRCLIALVFLYLAFMYIFRNYTAWKTIHSAYNNDFTKQVTKREFEIVERRAVPMPLPKRVNLIMLSLPRSGSSFLGDVFNHHPQVLYLFEPLHSLQRNINDGSLFEFNFSSASYQISAAKFLEDVMFCKFVDGDFTSNIFANDRKRSFALMSPPFCFKNGTSLACHDLNPRELEAVCSNTYRVVAMKILTPRMITGQWKKPHLLSSCPSNSESECRIIHMVRDPRAVIESLMSTVQFFTRRWEPKRELNWFVEKICRQLESDVTMGILTRNSLGVRYKLIRFEDLASYPLSLVNELYKFAGIEMLDSIKKWLYETTHSGGKGQSTVKKAYETSRDSEQIVSKWRTKMNGATVQMIEKHCGTVMRQLGYKLTGTSLDKQLNLNISLID